MPLEFWNGLLHPKIIKGFLVYSSIGFMYLFIIAFISFMHWNLSCFIGCDQTLTLLFFFQMATQLFQQHLCNYSSFPNGLRFCIFFPYMWSYFLDFQFCFFFFFLYIHTLILRVAIYNVILGTFHNFLMIKFPYF